jgi:hypothetical protein
MVDSDNKKGRSVKIFHASTTKIGQSNKEKRERIDKREIKNEKANMQFDLQLNPLLNLQSVFQFHLEVVV